MALTRVREYVRLSSPPSAFREQGWVCGRVEGVDRRSNPRSNRRCSPAFGGTVLNSGVVLRFLFVTIEGGANVIA